MQSNKLSSSRCLVTITATFIAWKTTLLLVASSSPGIGYDTSSSLLEDFLAPAELTVTPFTLQHFLTKFVRWDAIYFTQIAARQYVFEQEWAFSFAFSKVVCSISRCTFTVGASKHTQLTCVDIPYSASLNELQAIALSGVLVSHSSHLCSAYVVYFLTHALYVQQSVHSMRVALGAAILHVISPAGIFLSAPYTESLFSFLNISGLALYLRGMNRIQGHATLTQRIQLVAAGLLFGIATTIRSNGFLSGVQFLYDALARTWAIIQHGFTNRRVYDLAALIIGGILVASGLAIPQAFAYRMYCVDAASGVKQPWCFKALPSIYTWVQDNYW